ncbi:MAG: hypothetical protein ABEL51_09430 [Salinibacter sp.]
MSVRYASVVLVLCMVGAGSASAQNNRFTERSFLPSPRVRGMGGAGVALPGPDRPFFYNPAHLPRITSYFTVTGGLASASGNMREQIRFLNHRVQPAIESNFEGDPDALDALYRDAYRLGRHPARGGAAVVLPAFVYSSQNVGIGGGLFAKTSLNYRITGAELGVPEVYLLSRTDVMAVLSFGVTLAPIGLPGLSVGGTLKRTQRYLTFENKPLDTFSPDETALFLLGNTVQVDVGGLYTPSWWELPGRLSVGGAVYDLLDDRYDYTIEDATPRVPFLSNLFSGAPADSAEGTRDAARARRKFRLQPSYRVGVAYRLSSLGGLDEVGLALDYQEYGHDRQHPLARLHAGIRAEVIDGVVLRGGLSAGYPTGGIGLHLGVLRIDYALHAFEGGRVPGQRGTYVHTARFMIRIQ